MRNSYTEVTPARERDHHLMGPREHCRPEDGGKGKVEMYVDGRFLTLTGQHVQGTPATIEDRAEELRRIHSRIFGEKEPKPKPMQKSGPGSFRIGIDREGEAGRERR